MTSKQKFELFEGCQELLDDDDVDASAAWNVLDLQFRAEARNELATHPKKIEEVARWLEQAFDYDAGSDVIARQPYLLMVGPSGSCKTTTLQTLAKEMNIEVVEFSYVTESAAERDAKLTKSDNQTSTDESSCFPPPFSDSQLVQFQTFVLNNNRYVSNLLSFQRKQPKQRKLLLVEEYPNGFLMYPKPYIDSLKSFSSQFSKLTPIVFILSSMQTNSTKSSFSTTLEYKLFPRPVIQALNMHVIKFNPVATNLMNAALKRIEFISRVSKQDVDAIVSASNGDIRAAFNAIEMHFRHCRTLVQPNGTRDAKRRKCEVRTELNSLGRDAYPCVFRTLGKILYAKRVQRSGTNKQKEQQKSSACSSDKWHLQLPLVEDPTKLIEQAAVSAAHLNSHLFQNYVKFVNDFDQAAAASAALSDADCLAKGDSDYSLGSRLLWEDYQNEIAVRGLLHSLPPTLVEEDANGRLKKRPKKQPNGIISGARLEQLNLQQQEQDLSTPSHSSASRKNLFSRFEKIAVHDVKRAADSLAEDCRALQFGLQRPSSSELIIDILPYVAQMTRHASRPELRNSIASHLLDQALNWSDCRKAWPAANKINGRAQTNGQKSSSRDAISISENHATRDTAFLSVGRSQRFPIEGAEDGEDLSCYAIESIPD